MKPLSSVHIFRKARNGILNYNKSNNTIIKAKKKKKQLEYFGTFKGIPYLESDLGFF